MSGKPVEEMMKNDATFGMYSAENLKTIVKNVSQDWQPYLKLVSEQLDFSDTPMASFNLKEKAEKLKE